MALNNTDDIIQALFGQKRDLRRSIARLRSEIEALERKDSEVDVTLRTLAALGVVPTGESAAPTVKSHEELAPTPPPNPKTVPEMILSVLGHPSHEDGLEPNAVLNIIRVTFDPNVDPNNVRPTIWRMAKSGRLEKVGERYRIPKTDEAVGADPQERTPTASITDPGPDGVRVSDQPSAQGREAEFRVGVP